jgi:hypothetical protein
MNYILMGKLHDKIIDFKILLKKFLKNTETGIHISCKTKKVLDDFRHDIDNNRELFISKNPDVLSNIRLFKTMKFDKIKWDYLFEMYNTTLEENETLLEIVDTNTQNINMNGLSGILGNPAIANLIQQILPVVQESLKNKDTSNLDPNELIAALTSGNLKNNSTGIDLTSVVEKTTKLVNEKIASKELNF